MIKHLEKYSPKTTYMAALILFTVGLVFFASCSGLSTEQETSGSSMIRMEDSDMKHYKSYDWGFALDIPSHWNTSPPVPSNSPSEVIRFGSKENGNHLLIIFRSPHDPQRSLNELSDQIQQILANGGFGNFFKGETTIGSKPVVTLDFDIPRGDETWSCREYFVADGRVMYVLGFGTTNKDGMFELYDGMAKTFETLETDGH